MGRASPWATWSLWPLAQVPELLMAQVQAWEPRPQESQLMLGQAESE